MHKEFKSLLDKASSNSEFVIAVNIDIRGFSSFSNDKESCEAAIFIKKVYQKLLTYFPEASFFKPTGDGLLIIFPIIPYNEKRLQEVAKSTFTPCINILNEFPDFCKNDILINFDVPTKLGIGLSRGAATRISSVNSKGTEKTLDYSGRPLNLASRLMDIARPEGIVFDSSLNFCIDLFPEQDKSKIKEDNVYIQGIAESEPIIIYYHENLTTIAPRDKQPINKMDWYKKELVSKTLGDLIKEGYTGNFHYKIPAAPLDIKQMTIKVSYPAMRSGKKTGIISWFMFQDFAYYTDADEHKISVNFTSLVEQLQNKDVKSSHNVTIELKYPKQL